MTRKAFLTTLAGLIALNGFIGSAHAQSDPTAVEFPMVGIGFNQTYQLNVVAFNPCAIQITILDSAGTPVKQFRPGNPTFGSITFGHGVSAFPQRKELHGVVTLQPTTTSPCQARATVEVFDDFTGTDWVMAPGLAPPGPTNVPIFLGPVGLIFEQTARLNVVSHPPQPCFGTLSFTDTAGNPLSSPSAVSLAAGTATFIDLPGQGIAPIGQRREIIGVFTPSATVAPGVCIPSIEVFDQITGYTRVLAPPGPPINPAGSTITAP
jgi:hypothetical protein